MWQPVSAAVCLGFWPERTKLTSVHQSDVSSQAGSSDMTNVHYHRLAKMKSVGQVCKGDQLYGQCLGQSSDTNVAGWKMVARASFEGFFFWYWLFNPFNSHH